MRMRLSFLQLTRTLPFSRARCISLPRLTVPVWSVVAPDFTLPTVVLEASLQDILDQRIPHESGFTKVLDGASVPFVFESYYIAKNERFFEISAYQLNYLAVVPDRQYAPAKITFQGITFLRRLPPETDPTPFLEDLWSLLQPKRIREGAGLESQLAFNQPPEPNTASAVPVTS